VAAQTGHLKLYNSATIPAPGGVVEIITYNRTTVAISGTSGNFFSDSPLWSGLCIRGDWKTTGLGVVPEMPEKEVNVVALMVILTMAGFIVIDGFVQYAQTKRQAEAAEPVRDRAPIAPVQSSFLPNIVGSRFSRTEGYGSDSTLWSQVS
jgi:hypothetical protein